METPAACHVHSNWSYDGSWSLEALSIEFARRGYRALLMTEHDRGFTEQRRGEYRAACMRASSDRLLVLPGIEYSDASNTVHILVWGNVPFLGENVPTDQTLTAVREANGVAVFAHPSRRQAWQVFDPVWADRLLGIEVWNRKTDGWHPSRTAARLFNHRGPIPFVGLDFHTRKQLFPLGMALDVHGTVSEESVLECLRDRRCEARVFGLPLNHKLIRRSLRFLSVAERGRRGAAFAYKKLLRAKPGQKSAAN